MAGRLDDAQLHACQAAGHWSWRAKSPSSLPRCRADPPCRTRQRVRRRPASLACSLLSAGSCGKHASGRKHAGGRARLAAPRNGSWRGGARSRHRQAACPAAARSQRAAAAAAAMAWMPRSFAGLLAVALVFRVCNALLTRAYAPPDEYWQATEVAHRLVFGNGFMCVRARGRAGRDTITG